MTTPHNENTTSDEGLHLNCMILVCTHPLLDTRELSCHDLQCPVQFEQLRMEKVPDLRHENLFAQYLKFVFGHGSSLLHSRSSA